jgi:hypothetical protein
MPSSTASLGRRILIGAGLGTYGWLLIAMLTTLFVGPMVSGAHWGVRFTDWIAGLVIIAAIVSVTSDRRHAISLAVIGLVTIVPQVLSAYAEGLWIGHLANIGVLLFLFYLFILIQRDIFTQQNVTVDTLVGSICGYLLLAGIFAAICASLVLIEPNSFMFTASLPGDHDPSSLHFQGSAFGLLSYFSLITLTTVGYGDIIPATSAARGVISAEALAGQAYLTIIVARMVGLHLVANHDANKVNASPKSKEQSQ